MDPGASSDRIESLLRRDRLLVAVALAGLIALCWAYLLVLAAEMSSMDGGMVETAAMPAIAPWSALDFALMFVMWVVMMIGMMLPSAAPMILLFASFHRRQRREGHPFVPASIFVAGYLVVWTAFSLAATLLQWTLERVALLSPMMVATSPLLGGLLLIAAGVFQWTPLKEACLRHCRSPMAFVATAWRPGPRGAFVMGLHHGAYCLGCCWILMGLLFFGGVMSLLWIAGIAIFVLIEKVAPAGAQAGRVSGLALLAAGLLVILRS